MQERNQNIKITKKLINDEVKKLKKKSKIQKNSNENNLSILVLTKKCAKNFQSFFILKQIWVICKLSIDTTIVPLGLSCDTGLTNSRKYVIQIDLKPLTQITFENILRRINHLNDIHHTMIYYVIMLFYALINYSMVNYINYKSLTI